MSQSFIQKGKGIRRYMPTIGEQLRAARKARGLTQEQLAEKMKVTCSGIAKWESGQRIPDGKKLLELSSILDYRFQPESAAEK